MLYDKITAYNKKRKITMIDLHQYMNDNILPNGQEVTVFELGDLAEYPATIAGIIDGPIIPTYIVKIAYPGSTYDCRAIIASCIKELKQQTLVVA
jgi:hypothetical protein